MRAPDQAGSSPSRIRQANVAASLLALQAHGAMSRAELARKLGLNRSSSGQIAAELAASGLVQEVEGRVDSGRAGRPGILLDLIPDAAFFIGIEIGVEHISTALIDLAGTIRSRHSLPFNTADATVKQALNQAVALALDGLTDLQIARCQGAGFSIPAHIMPGGHVILAPLIGWRDVSFAELARSLLPPEMPVIVENDANAFAFGDGYKHGQTGVTLFLLAETGVGGGILIDGKLFRGGHGLSGEIGHMLIPGSGARKLEQLIGRRAVLARYRATGHPDADLPEFLDAVRHRQPAAVIVAEDWSRNLALALLQACRLIDPNRIVLGGAMAALYPLVAARVAAHMATDPAIRFPAPSIVVDDDPRFGSAFGAACLMHQRFLSTPMEVAP
jgi:predicted NBD/HSP70 family sugar kinase